MDLQKQSKSEESSAEEVDAYLTSLIPSQLFSHRVDDSIFQEVKDELISHPDKSIQAWNRNPRLYVLLRSLGHEHGSKVFNVFEREEVGDVWLPFPSKTLHKLCKSAGISPDNFEDKQRQVLSDQECLNQRNLPPYVSEHCHFESGEDFFENIDVLGVGSSAEVAKVRHKASGQYFACKRIYRADNSELGKKRLRMFRQEVEILKHVQHQHFVRLEASFTDPKSFSLILSPVAEKVLKKVLDRQSRETPLQVNEILMLRHTFLCLATAISYLHEQKVRHKDIKPGNILLSNGRVRLCDFGFSRDWSKGGDSTTEGQVFDFTRRYCAPEVFNHDPRTRSSDIWSLGCVYLEIITVIKGYPLEEMNDFLEEHSDGASRQHGLYLAHDAMLAWMVRIRDGSSADDLPLDWCTPMTRTKPSERLAANEVLDMIVKQASNIPRPGLYMSRCCTRTDSMFDRPGSPSSTSLSSSDDNFRPPSNAERASTDGVPIGPMSNDHVISTTLDHQPDVVFVPNCFCKTQANEKEIFSCTFESCHLDPLERKAAETNTKCELNVNKVQLYETPPRAPRAGGTQLPMLWWVTRRLVLSYLYGEPELRRCTSFWVPLADVYFTISESEVTVQFSDCNQMRARRSGSWGYYYDWVYDGQNPNNTLHIRFHNEDEARKFVDTIRLPYEDGIIIKHGRHNKIDNSTEQKQEVNVYSIGREKDVRNYRAASITTSDPARNLCHSKLFIIWPEVDLHLQVRHRKRRARLVNIESSITIVVTMGNVSTPTYISNVLDKPAEDNDQIGTFQKAVKVKSAASILFSHERGLVLCDPPSELVESLVALTGWKLVHFSQVTTFKARSKFFLTKKGGRADIMLWTKQSLPIRSAFQVTLRQHDEREFLWTSGTVTTSTSVSTSSSSPLDATITVANKSRGVLLDISDMIAIKSERSSDIGNSSNSHSHNHVEHSDSDDDESKLVLSFEDGHSRQHFLNILHSSRLGTYSE